MRKVSIVIASILLAAGFASAAENADVMKPVHQFIDGFNKGDAKSALAACADEAPLEAVPVAPPPAMPVLPPLWAGVWASKYWMSAISDTIWRFLGSSASVFWK